MLLGLLEDAIFGDTGSSIFPKDSRSQVGLLALLVTRIVSYLLRVTTQNMKFREGYVVNLPLPPNLHWFCST